jgi:Fe-S cluster assembly iron-binding protein IscA
MYLDLSGMKIDFIERKMNDAFLIVNKRTKSNLVNDRLNLWTI